ncbi:MAG: tRNA pseudouridine(55) synthase TruB [Flavobacteriaceae bacterium]|jgi:tRNA pseudouridine55 synthase|nr:tRNA pseudouridine(55) synthase TruB [Flavobacteriaceae bacterium]|tara:strand:- start:836 stop:1543 length:708 start_codon:yes stop_codon:yes gene_type:complete
MNIIHTKEAFLKGQLLLIDKPLEWTSFQVVNKIRWAIRKKFDIKKIKVGHAGTLDPLATGLMLICTGRMTKQIEQFMGMRKTYTGSFRLGSTTTSYDLETSVNEPKPIDHISDEMLEEVRADFLGNIQQKPPLHSAIKKGGKRLYELARAGKTTEIPFREIQINDFELTEINMPDISFSVICSKGTYIRSLAHDFGQKLGCGAHLTSLKRTAIGSYLLSDTLTINEFLHNLEEKS